MNTFILSFFFFWLYFPTVLQGVFPVSLHTWACVSVGEIREFLRSRALSILNMIDTVQLPFPKGCLLPWIPLLFSWWVQVSVMIWLKIMCSLEGYQFCSIFQAWWILPGRRLNSSTRRMVASQETFTFPPLKTLKMKRTSSRLIKFEKVLLPPFPSSLKLTLKWEVEFSHTWVWAGSCWFS